MPDMGRFAELDVDGDGELNAEEQNAVTVGPRIRPSPIRWRSAAETGSQ
jgi:hypothetical protein